MSPLQLVPQGSYWLVYMTRFGGIPVAYWLTSVLIRDYGHDLGDTLQKDRLIHISAQHRHRYRR